MAGLATSVEGTRHLGSAERPVVQQAPVVAGERDALGSGLVDNVDRDFGQAVDVGLAGPVVAALDGVVEEAVDRVAVVGVVLGCVDSALGGDAVGPSGAVVEGESLDPVAQLAQRGGGRGASQAGADHDDVEPTLVVGVDQLHGELVVLPLVGDGAGGDLGVQGRAGGRGG